MSTPDKRNPKAKNPRRENGGRKDRPTKIDRVPKNPAEAKRVNRSKLEDEAVEKALARARMRAEVEYTPDSALRHPVRLAKEMVRDFQASHELIARFFTRNIKALYRQTIFGLFWAFLPPITNSAIWVFLSHQEGLGLAKQVTVPYSLFVLVGMILWQTFIEAFQAPMNAVQSGKAMLNKIRFARESLVYVAVLEVLFNLALRLPLIVAAIIYFQQGVTWQVALAPIGMLAMILFAAGLGMLIAPWGVLYHDIGRFLAIITPLWMIVTPVAYVKPDGVIGEIMTWANPATPLLLLTRDWLLSDGLANPLAGFIWLGLSLPIFIWGLIVFRVSMPIVLERGG